MQNTGTVPVSRNLPDRIMRQEQDSSKLFAEIVRKIPVGLSIWRLENPEDIRTFRLILSNAAAGEASGIDSEKFRGTTLGESFPKLLETDIPKILREVVLSGKGQDLREIRYGDENIREAVFSAKAFPLPTNCVGVVFENVTGRKKAEDLIANQAQMLDLAHDAILVRDLNGKITYWNKGAERMYGWSAAEALGESAWGLLETELPKPLAEIKEILFREGHWEGELVQNKRDGARFVSASRWILQRNKAGTPVGWLQINCDITERRRAEKALKEAGELARRTSEITLLSQMGSLLQTCLTAEEAYNVISQFGRKLFPNETGSLYVLSASRNLVEAAAVWGSSPPGEQVFAPDDCWALRSGRFHAVDDPGSAMKCRHVHQEASGYICVPMTAQSDTLGVLHLHNDPNGQSNSAVERGRLEFSKQQLAMTVAEQIGLALANLRLRDTLRTLSVRDPLTGLFNRRYMEESLERELRRAARKNRPLGIILLDIDHFKMYNDTLGHESGDTLLRELGNFLQAHVRGEDVACRYGGEEFILILPDTSLEIGQHRAEQLREGVKHLEIYSHGQPLGTVTLSLGVSVYPEHGITAQALLRSADDALYVAKKNGRDRVVVWHSL